MTSIQADANLIKICGLRATDHALAAAAAGADLIGFMFAPSRRQVTLAEAAVIIERVRQNFGRNVLMVGVFVEPTFDELRTAIQIASIEMIQIHGSVDPQIAELVSVPIYTGVAPKPGAGTRETIEKVRQNRTMFASPWTMLDAYDPVQHGGTGKRADWNLASEIALEEPLMLAGGLNPGNVGEAIQTVRPLVVDVSSGVEIDGGKDIDLIRQFITVARSAFEHRAS
jgi:phosphoribosylanthranilate isomerase